MRRHLTPELVLLALGAFLGTVIGGHVTIEPMPLPPGGIVAGVMGGGELPLMARALVGALIGAGLVAVLLRRVIQLPSLAVSVPVLVLVVVLGLSVFLSDFRLVSASAWLTWVVYAMAFFLAVSAVGRRVGPRLVLGALVAGGAVVSLKGIAEYLSRMAVEPTYRIFADYNNPNALAGLLIVLLPVAIGLAMAGNGGGRWAAVGAGALIAVALVLTQSRGGYLAAAVSLVALAGLALGWGGGRGRLLWAVAPLVLAGLVTLGIRAVAPGEAAGAFARVTGQVATGEQSRGYRLNLWRGTAELVGMRPQGWGIGTYRYQSARPGITPQTYMSHQTYLQTAAEGGVLALVAFLAAAAAWFVPMFRSARSMPPETNMLRAGVVAGVVAAGAHGLVESNLFYFGIGLTVFVLLGTGLQLTADGSAPELTPPAARRALSAVAGLFVLALSYFGYVELLKANVATALVEGRREDLQLGIMRLQRVAPGDGEAYTLALRDPDRNMPRWEGIVGAAELFPNTRNLRAYARWLAANGDRSGAAVAFGRALTLDPNNLATLWQIVEMYRHAEDEDLAVKFAARLVAVEETPYYQVRAIPEIVPTETFKAREFLAGRETEVQARIELLRPAFEGYVRFAQTTAPLVLMAERDPAMRGQGFLGLSSEDVARDLDSGTRIGRELEPALRAAGDAAGADEVVKGLSVLAEARASAATVTSPSSP